MNILHVNDFAHVARHLAEAQRARSHRVRLVSIRGGPLRWNLAAMRHLPHFREADVVHIHGGIWRSHLGLGLLRAMNPDTPFLVHLHGSETRSRRGLQHLGWADALLCSTPDLQRYVPEAQWVPNPQPKLERSAPPSEEGSVVVGHFPTQRDIKGTSHLLKAFAELASPPLEKVRTGGIEKVVASELELWIVEGQPHRAAMEVMRRCDIIVDQVNNLGGYGMVAIEAMALGKVVISSYRPALYDDPPILRASPTNLLEVLQDLLRRREEWRALGEAGRAYVDRVHDSDVVAKRLLRLYYSLLAEKAWTEGEARRYWVRRGRRYMKTFPREGEGEAFFERQEEELTRVLRALSYSRYIEVGGGFGRITRLVHGPETEGVVLDLSLDQLLASRHLLPEGAMHRVRGNASDLPFRDGSADLVLAVEVLMHIPPEAIRRTLAEMVRVSRRYVLNLDWWDEDAVGLGIRYNWVHDYADAYRALGLDVTIFPGAQGSKQRIFLAQKGGNSPNDD